MKTQVLLLAFFVAVLGFFSLAMPLAAALPEVGEVRIREASSLSDLML